MSTEKDTYQKSGTSVVFQKEIKQCRECPHCLIVPDPDPNDWFNDDDEKALCKESENKLIEGMLRPFADTLKSVLGKKELEEKKAETTEFEEVK